MTDPIAQMVSIIKNGYLARKKELQIPYSKFKEEILDVLLKEGFLEKVKVEEPRKKIMVSLKYKERKPALDDIKLISKPGLRVYKRSKNLKKVMGGLGIKIVSTSSGVMTDSQAFKKKLGGEVILEVF